MEKSTTNLYVAAAIDYLLGDSAVAKLAGLKTTWAVAKWRQKLPERRALWLAKQTGFKFTPHQLDPEMYPNPTDGLPPGFVLGPDPLEGTERRSEQERRSMEDRRAEEDRRQLADRRDTDSEVSS
jgi:hypothetical protein